MSSNSLSARFAKAANLAASLGPDKEELGDTGDRGHHLCEIANAA